MQSTLEVNEFRQCLPEVRRAQEEWKMRFSGAPPSFPSPAVPSTSILHISYIYSHIVLMAAMRSKGQGLYLFNVKFQAPRVVLGA